jgi:Flp pilus assembly secretin CpaC
VKANRQNQEGRCRKAAEFGLIAAACLGWAVIALAAQQPPPQVAALQAVAPSTVGERGTESVHVLVGHSLLIRTSERVKRIVNGNPAVLEWVLTSPRELVITAKQTGGSSLMLWDETGQNRMLDVFADLDVAPLRTTLERTFPNSGVEAQSEADKVILVGVVASAPVAEQMLKMAATFSRESSTACRSRCRHASGK